MKELIFSDGSTIPCAGLVENSMLGIAYIVVPSDSGMTFLDVVAKFSNPDILTVLTYMSASISGYTNISSIGLESVGFSVRLSRPAAIQEVQNA